MRSILASIALLVSFQILLLGCSSNKKQDKDTLVLALSAPPNTLDPRFTTDATGMRIASLIFNSLVRMGPELKIIGDAAETWDFKNLTYTFHLRPGLTFSNGDKITPEDILFTFAQYQSDKSPFKAALNVVEKVEASETDGRMTVTLKLTHFSATLIPDLSPIKILPKKVVEKAGDDFQKNLVGSGSFILVENSPNEIRLQARPDLTWAQSKEKNVVFKIIRDDSTRYLRTIKGDLDLVQADMPLSKVKDLEKNADFEVKKYPGLSMSYLLCNLKDPLLKNIELRQALAMAINRSEIIKYKMEGLAQEATSILTPQNPFYNTEIKNLPYDLGHAKKIIEKLGFTGKELILKVSNNPAAVENAKVIAQQLSQIGLQVKLQSFEWGTFYGDIQKGNFQLATLRWVGATDPDIYRMAFHSKEVPPGRNRGFYVNPKLDHLLEEGLQMTDEAKRRQHYMQVQKIVLDELPMIPLWYDQQVSVLNKRVKGYQVPLNGDYSVLLNLTKD